MNTIYDIKSEIVNISSVSSNFIVFDGRVTYKHKLRYVVKIYCSIDSTFNIKSTIDYILGNSKNVEVWYYLDKSPEIGCIGPPSGTETYDQKYQLLFQQGKKFHDQDTIFVPSFKYYYD